MSENLSITVSWEDEGQDRASTFPMRREGNRCVVDTQAMSATLRDEYEQYILFLEERYHVTL